MKMEWNDWAVVASVMLVALVAINASDETPKATAKHPIGVYADASVWNLIGDRK